MRRPYRLRLRDVYLGFPDPGAMRKEVSWEVADDRMGP